MLDLVEALVQTIKCSNEELARAGELLGVENVPAPPPAPAGRHPLLSELLIAKAESDRRNYPAKHAILRRLLAGQPSEFEEDSRSKGIVGLTHKPTRFRIHAPADVVGNALRKQSFQKKANPFLSKLLSKGVDTVRRHPGWSKSLGGAAAGAGLTAYELNSGIADPNLSPNGKWGLLAANMAALGSTPHRGSWVRPNGGLRYIPNAARGMVLAMGPRLASYTDASYKGIKAINSADRYGLEQAVSPLADPGGSFARAIEKPLMERVDRGMNFVQTELKSQIDAANKGITGAIRDTGTEVAKSFAPEFGRTLGYGMGGLMSGSVAGWLGGKALGRIIAPDDESSDYKSRRRRENWRGISELLGSTVGGAAGMYGMQKYGPQMFGSPATTAAPVAPK